MSRQVERQRTSQERQPDGLQPNIENNLELLKQEVQKHRDDLKSEGGQDKNRQMSESRSQKDKGKKWKPWKSEHGYTYVDEHENDPHDEGDATRMAPRERQRSQF
jgi:hypothetical protein